MSQMVTPKEAEILAQQAIQNYLNACCLQTATDAGNALMKLCSVAGLVMCATVGQEEAVARLEGTAAYIGQPQFSGGWKMGKVN